MAAVGLGEEEVGDVADVVVDGERDGAREAAPVVVQPHGAGVVAVAPDVGQVAGGQEYLLSEVAQLAAGVRGVEGDQVFQGEAGQGVGQAGQVRRKVAAELVEQYGFGIVAETVVALDAEAGYHAGAVDPGEVQHGVEFVFRTSSRM